MSLSLTTDPYRHKLYDHLLKIPYTQLKVYCEVFNTTCPICSMHDKTIKITYAKRISAEKIMSFDNLMQLMYAKYVEYNGKRETFIREDNGSWKVFLMECLKYKDKIDIINFLDINKIEYSLEDNTILSTDEYIEELLTIPDTIDWDKYSNGVPIYNFYRMLNSSSIKEVNRLFRKYRRQYFYYLDMHEAMNFIYTYCKPKEMEFSKKLLYCLLFSEEVETKSSKESYERILEEMVGMILDYLPEYIEAKAYPYTLDNFNIFNDHPKEDTTNE